MAPAYDLARSKYAATLVAGFFAAALLVLAVMVASTSAGVGGTLRPAATPAESRTVVDGPTGPALPVLRETAIPGLPNTPDQGGVTFTGAGPVPTPPPAAPSAPPADPTTAPVIPAAPATPVDGTINAAVEKVEAVVDEITANLGLLADGTTTADLLP